MHAQPRGRRTHTHILATPAHARRHMRKQAPPHPPNETHAGTHTHARTLTHTGRQRETTRTRTRTHSHTSTRTRTLLHERRRATMQPLLRRVSVAASAEPYIRAVLSPSSKPCIGSSSPLGTYSFRRICPERGSATAREHVRPTPPLRPPQLSEGPPGLSQVGSALPRRRH